jgi:hypothetical protein
LPNSTIVAADEQSLVSGAQGECGQETFILIFTKDVDKIWMILDGECQAGKPACVSRRE